MKDWRFLYNRYIRRIRKIGGYKFDFKMLAAGGILNEEYLSPWILKWGEQFVDVGANAGAWSMPASKYYREVIAFEANPETVKSLKRNLRINNVTNVIVMPHALGANEQEKDFYLYTENGGDSFLENHNDLHPTGQKIMLKTRTLDSFKLEPTVLKVDTEGYEYEVLKGAQNTIAKNKPILIVEVHVNQNIELLERLLPSYKWQILWSGVKGPHLPVMIGNA